MELECGHCNAPATASDVERWWQMWLIVDPVYWEPLADTTPAQRWDRGQFFVCCCACTTLAVDESWADLARRMRLNDTSTDAFIDAISCLRAVHAAAIPINWRELKQWQQWLAEQECEDDNEPLSGAEPATSCSVP